MPFASQLARGVAERASAIQRGYREYERPLANVVTYIVSYGWPTGATSNPPQSSSPRAFSLVLSDPLNPMGGTLSLFTSTPNPNIRWSATPAYVSLSDRIETPEGTSGKISVHALLQSYCPSLFTSFQPAWWLFNGHLQTAFSVIGDFSQVDRVVYDRKYLELKDGGTIGLDFAPAAAECRMPGAEAPTIVILHGLTGNSHEAYVRAVVASAVASVNDGGLGYRAVVVNFRGCAGVPLTSPQLYSSSHTDDLRQALLYISKLWPKSPLLGVGFSLGANVLTRYVAEEGESCRLISACALSCPWDITKNGWALESDWLHRNAYANSLGANMKAIVKQHEESIKKFPDSRLAQCLPELFSRETLTLRQFDNLITVHAGGSQPPFPFADALDFYDYASTHKVLGGIRIPFLALNADDDPIVRSLPTDIKDNGWVSIVVTRGGGHIGWFGPPNGFSQTPTRWFKQPILEWLRATAENIRHDYCSLKPVLESDGWLIEPGRQDIGCKEVGSGGLVEGDGWKQGMLAGL
ncbi:Alpha/Beta hydrolase protein [Gloeopeniophorella convolvens]|nr:Alpha/Beta hydrolase protein [Gloeopeniophorella convolvens]